MEEFLSWFIVFIAPLILVAISNRDVNNEVVSDKNTTGLELGDSEKVKDNKLVLVGRNGTVTVEKKCYCY